MTTRRVPKALTPAELDAISDATATDPELAAICTLLHETGMRSAELRSISAEEARGWPDPPWYCRRRFCSAHAVAIWIVGKGDKERRVLLTPKAVRAAKALLPTANGQLVRLAERTLRTRFQQLSSATGIHVHQHRFRHTLVTELVEAGVPLQVAADMAGHSQLDVTRIYSESSVRARREALRRRGRWLRRDR